MRIFLWLVGGILLYVVGYFLLLLLGVAEPKLTCSEAVLWVGLWDVYANGARAKQ